MKMNIAFALVSIGTALCISSPVFAASYQQVLQTTSVRVEKRQMIQNAGATVGGIPVKKILKAAQIRGTVTAKATDSFGVLGSDGKTYTVNVDASTQWRRKFWGKSDFNETNINDVLNIFGKWTDDEMTSIQAKLIRNISIQKRNGVFFGQVKTVNSTGWVMSTNRRGDQTVTITGSTRLIDRKETSISQSSIVVGHRVRVKGLWDSKTNTITEVVQVKDFDLPAKPTPTPNP